MEQEGEPEADGSQLYFAVEENNVTKLAELLDRGCNVDEFYDDTMNISSKSLLHVCCGKGHAECLKVLIDHGAQLDVRDKWGQTPLMYCAIIQFPEVARVLLEADPELVKCQDRFGKSSLHCAVETGNEEMVHLLLDFGANVNIRCHDGTTPLMMCCNADPTGERSKAMKILLEAGALIELADYRGKRTALHVAVSSGNVTAVETLIGVGADINAVDKTLRTPLTLAIFSGVRGPVVQEHTWKIITLLISAGAEINMNISESCNPLMSSALLKCDTLVRYFLSLGATPNVKFPSGVSPALVSASTGHLDTLKTLLLYNCDLTIKGNVYKRRRRVEYILDPFELAYMEGYLDLCVLMVNAGYRVHSKLQIFVTDSNKTIDSPQSLMDRLGYTSFAQCSDELTLSHSQNLPENYKDTLQWLIEAASTPRSLREEAVVTIRRAMGCHVVEGVKSLPLPQRVKDYVLLSHLVS